MKDNEHYDMEDAVREFHRKFHHPIDEGFDFDTLLFRYKLMNEEVTEFFEALIKDDKENMLDALADILYVTIGRCISIGVKPSELVKEVQNSNMLKIPNPDCSRNNKPLKPDEWISPNFKYLVNKIIEVKE